MRIGASSRLSYGFFGTPALPDLMPLTAMQVAAVAVGRSRHVSCLGGLPPTEPLAEGYPRRPGWAKVVPPDGEREDPTMTMRTMRKRLVGPGIGLALLAAMIGGCGTMTGTAVG